MPLKIGNQMVCRIFLAYPNAVNQRNSIQDQRICQKQQFPLTETLEQMMLKKLHFLYDHPLWKVSDMPISNLKVKCCFAIYPHHRNKKETTLQISIFMLWFLIAVDTIIWVVIRPKFAKNSLSFSTWLDMACAKLQNWPKVLRVDPDKKLVIKYMYMCIVFVTQSELEPIKKFWRTTDRYRFPIIHHNFNGNDIKDKHKYLRVCSCVLFLKGVKTF